MKRLLVLFLLFFLPAPAQAGVPCSVPFTLTNGSIADATQVMANYNALIACLANAAAAGANSDITSLTGLTAPLTPAFGGTSNYVGGTATGSVNALVLPVVTPSNFTLVAGNKVVFFPVGNNSGPTTLNVNGTGVKNVMRVDPLVGVTSLGGGEIIGPTGMVEVVYDGTQYQIRNPAQALPIGAVFDMAGICPLGSVEANGSTVSAATFPGLNNVLGMTWGTSSGNVVLPDLRGRATFSRDIGGSGRITVAGGNFDGTVLGAVGGQQSRVVGQANLAAFNLSVTDPGHVHTFGQPVQTTTLTGSVATPTGANLALTLSQTQSATTGITVATGGSATPLATLSNAAITIKCIRL
jgi:hypothetical protein